MSGLTHYEVLQVTPSASPEVINAAYRACLQKFHPDHGGDPVMLARVQEAGRILRNTQNRTGYDALLAQPPADLIGGTYKVIKQIASGRIGTTYLAEHVELNSQVCIKHARQISPDYEAILSHEAKAMWDLRHHGIPAIRDYVRLGDGSVAIVMGYIEGPTLHNLVTEKGPISPEDVCWIGERMLNALSYMHSQGVINGDVKPANTIIQPDTHGVTLVDFGLAVHPELKANMAGFSPPYASPEATKGMPLLPESDLYSLAATMIFALTGNERVVARRAVPDSVPEPLIEFLRSLVRRNPLERPNPMVVDIQDQLALVREKAFGRRRTGFQPIQHIHKQ